MPDDTLRKPGEGAPAGKPEEKPVGEQKSNNEDSSKKLEELEAQRLKDKADADAKIAKLEFENGFKDAIGEYPHASEYRDKIEERVKAGMSVKEATVLILHGEGKLQKREEIEAAAARESSFGGAADFRPPAGAKKPSEMTTEELREALGKEEEKGTFKLVDQ